MRIVGPYFRPWIFRMRRAGADAGSIVKRWSSALKELYTDADRFSMRFAAALDTRAKRLLLGAMMLIDSLYFEGRGPFERHFLAAPGVQILLVALVIGLLSGLPGIAGLTPMETPPPAAERSGPAVRQWEFLDLLERRQALSDLAQSNQYTVVEVYLDSCAICRRLESGFAPFTAKRSEVTIQRVHFPERGLELTVTATTQEEAEQQLRYLQAQTQSICGTPHVEIYGPDRRPIARDACFEKSGTRYLRRWIAAETAISPMDLQTAAGGGASTRLPAR